MAAEGEVGEFCSESARLREEIVNLITRRLNESISKKSKNLGIAKVLCKRKKKWRKKCQLEVIKPGEVVNGKSTSRNHFDTWPLSSVQSRGPEHQRRKRVY